MLTLTLFNEATTLFEEATTLFEEATIMLRNKYSKGTAHLYIPYVL